MQFDVQKPQPGRLLVRLEGVLDRNAVPSIRKKLLSAIRKNVSEGGVVSLDLSRAPEMDTAGVALLVEALESVSGCHSKLRLTGLSEKAGRLIRLTRLEQVFGLKDASQSPE
ncbi:MAG: STAS domain-containing protein [Syntrophobacteraceae bacterium]|jgi:anti-anti-sigma factor